MTQVRGMVVDAAGRPVAGVALVLRAQGWRGSAWQARSDARGLAVFELPPMRAASAGALTISAPGWSVDAVTRVGLPFLLTAPIRAAEAPPASSAPLLHRERAQPPARAPAPAPAPPAAGWDLLEAVAAPRDPDGTLRRQLLRAWQGSGPAVRAMAEAIATDIVEGRAR